MVVTYVGRSSALTHPPTGEIKFLPGQSTSKPFLPKSFRLNTLPCSGAKTRPRFPLTLISLTGLLEDSFSELPRSLAAIVPTYVSRNGRGSEALYLVYQAKEVILTATAGLRWVSRHSTPGNYDARA
jgi:hypothetical protein